MSKAVQHTKQAVASSFAMTILLTLTLATPANASDFVNTGELLVETGQTTTTFGQPEFTDNAPATDVQTLTVPDNTATFEDSQQTAFSEVNSEISEEYLAEQKKKADERKKAKAEAEAKKKAEQEAANQTSDLTTGNTTTNTTNTNTFTGPSINVPVSKDAAALVKAARDQIGVSQDCTDLVQNSLAAIGLFERRDKGGYDLGPMDFGRFGTAVSPDDAKPGDILMRGSHVAIYTGDGKNHSAVHGGWTGFTTVESPYEADPHAYSTVIRLS